LRLHARTARTLSTLLFACALNCVCPKTAEGQTGARHATARESKQQRVGRAEDPRRRADVREAVLALMETADDARSFDDRYYRASVQAEAADVLWPFDERVARSILRRAWEVTTAPGAVPAFKHEGDDDEDVLERVLEARRFIIAVATKHDARLAEGYVKGLRHGLDASEGEDGASDEGDSQRARDVERRPSWESVQRLRTASDLLDDGAYASAALIAAPVVNEGATGDLLNFVVALRARAPHEGDALYLRLLERTRVDPQANANDVLLLSQPIVSPDLQIFIGEDGSAHMKQLEYADEAARRAFSGAPPEVRRALYVTAAAVLLRPPPTPAGATNSDAATYFAIGRLLPFFEREAAQYVPALHTRMSALSAEMGAARAQSLTANMDTSSLAPRNPVDPLASGLEGMAQAADAGGRDRVRLRVVMDAARRTLWDRARTVAAEVEDAQSQREARRVIAIYQVMNVGHAYDDEPDGFERAAEFVRAADVPPEFRAAGLAEAAELAAHAGKRARAEALLDEALLFANQAERSGWRNLTALALVAQSAARVNSARTWDILATFVSLANQSEDLPGVELQFEVGYTQPDDAPFSYVPADSLSFIDVFADAARWNFGRTLREARSLKDGVMRALITVAVARAALERAAATTRRAELLRRGGK
jgi:hypothetical protein